MMNARFGIISFFVFSFFGMTLAFCDTGMKDLKKMRCNRAEKQEGLQKICFHERGMSDGLVCVYDAKSNPSGCSECKKKKRKSSQHP